MLTRLASDAVLEAAYAWLCRRRRDWPGARREPQIAAARCPTGRPGPSQAFERLPCAAKRRIIGLQDPASGMSDKAGDTGRDDGVGKENAGQLTSGPLLVGNGGSVRMLPRAPKQTIVAFAGILIACTMLFVLVQSASAAASQFQCPLYGLSFGPFVDGQSPDLGSFVSQKQLTERLELIRGSAAWVRTFGSTMGLGAAGKIAHQKGFSTAIGAWLDSNLDTNRQEIDSLIGAARAGDVDMAVVGSEALLRGDLSVDELISYMRQVRAAIPAGIPVTTDELYTTWIENPALVQEADVILANFYPFWDGAPIGFAIASLHGSYLRLRSVAGAKPILVGETGWPSKGEPFGDAVPSLNNAAFYLKNFVSWADAEAVDYFYFEALDEPWKAAVEGERGAHWGIYNKSGVMKTGIGKTLRCKRIKDNWTGRGIGPGPHPNIEFTLVPPIGSEDDLRGRVADVDPAAYAVAVYIRVRDGWWTKPFFNAPKTPIHADGGWITDITTGGIDSSATDIAAFLIPADFDPPLLGGQSDLPSELFDTAIAHIMTPRGLATEAMLNGGFEKSSIDPGGFVTLGAGSTVIKGWTVTSGSIDHVGTYWHAKGGSRSVDLNGDSPGGIEQRFFTRVGQEYNATFFMAGNPDGDPTQKALRATASDITVEFSFDATGRSRDHMGWVRKTFVFKATEPVTTLRFTSLTDGAFGPTIDKVSVARRR